MYAIVEIAGHQYKVSRGTKVYVNRLEASEGSKIEFDKVLLIDNDGKIEVGTPSVEGAKVAATVLSHLKGDKVIIFKKKRRKGYQTQNGHRQYLTQILVQDVLAKGAKASSELKTEKKPAKKAKEVKETIDEVKAAPVEKKAPAKKAAAKKAPAKKADTK
jgi:large subunit ribosomal protein L21